MRLSMPFVGLLTALTLILGMPSALAKSKYRSGSSSSHRAVSSDEWQKQADLCREYHGQSALEVCDRALRNAPGDTDNEDLSQLAMYRGLALAELGRHDDAADAFEEAVNLDHDNAKAYYNLGVAYEHVGKQRKAADAYTKASEIDHLQFPYEANDGGSDIPFEQGREVILRLAPQIAYFQGTGNDLHLNKFIYISFDSGVDVQIWKRWFATASFAYWRTRWNQTYGNAGVNIFAPTFGIRYVHWDNEMEMPDMHTFFDRSRYWFEVAAGPYITQSGGQNFDPALPFSESGTKIDIGANIGVGFDHYFTSHFGVGLEGKIHFVNYDESYLIFTAGPHILGRF